MGVVHRDGGSPALALTISNRQYIPPTKPQTTPRITKRHLVPNRLSIHMPPRAGIVITPMKEVTTETHFMASAILLTPYLSFSDGCIWLTAFSQSSPKSHDMHDLAKLFLAESTLAPTRIVSTEEGRQRQFAKDTRSIRIQGAGIHRHGFGLGWPSHRVPQNQQPRRTPSTRYPS